MKTRIYLKRWLESTITVIDIIAIMMLGMMADNLSIPTATLLIPGTIAIVCSIILMKYGRLGN